jgi:hypothetical protein
MKPLLLLAGASILSLSLHAQNPITQVAPANQPNKLQYNNLRIGNTAYAQKVMQAWKQYDENKMDAATTFLADNAVGIFSDGTVVMGADNLNKLFRDVRNSFASINEDVYACTTLKSPDDPEHEFVVIWGRETDTKKDGSNQKKLIHEVWRFNKDGKADECRQYIIPERAENESKQAPVKDQTYPVLKNISLGNPAYSDIVLKIWKDFENNSMDNSRPYFTDNVVGHSSAGMVVTGKENMFKTSNDFRNSLKDVKFRMVACTTLKSPGDPDHEIVMIWAERYFTMQDGMVLKTNAQEGWYFNKQGKIDQFYQFSALMPKE